MKIKFFCLAAMLCLVFHSPAIVGALPPDTTTEELVIQGRQALFNGGDMTVAGLLAARDIFEAAVDQDPLNQDAQAFYGCTHALAFLYEPGSTGAIDNLGELFEAFGSQRVSDSLLDTPFFSNPPQYDGKYDPPAGLPDGDDLHTFLAWPFLDRIDEVIFALEQVGDGYTTTIQAAETGGDPLEIDHADIKVLRAAAYAARAWALVVTAYDLDCSLADVVQLFNADVLQIQRDLLDRHPDLLKLDSTLGASRLGDARNALLAMIDNYRAAHTYIADQVYRFNNWRPLNMFTVEDLKDLNESALQVNQLTETEQSLNENRAASFTTSKEEWFLTDGISGRQIWIELERDADWTLVRGAWRGMDTCAFLGCTGEVQDLKRDGSNVTFVLKINAYLNCGQEATLTGTLSDDTIIDGTYNTVDCSGPVTGTFSGARRNQSDATDVVDFNALFGNTGKAPLDARAVLPLFNGYNRPEIDSFPGDPILNGLLPGPDPLLATNDDATRAFNLMFHGEFTIPTAAIAVDGGFSEWPEDAKVFDDIAQDDPDAVYGGNEDLKSFWMAQDNDYYYFRTVYHDGENPAGRYPAPDTEFIAHVYYPEENLSAFPPYCKVTPYPATGSGELLALKSPSEGWNDLDGPDNIRTGIDSSGDACVEWKVPKSIFGDLSGRHIEINTGSDDKNKTDIKFTGYFVSGTVAVDGHTGGNIFLKLYNGPDRERSDMLAATVLREPGIFTFSGLANMENVNTYLYAFWDQNGNGIEDYGDKTGVTSFYLTSNVTIPNVNINQTLDFPSLFTWSGAVNNDWQLRGNWDMDVVPPDGAEVSIPAGSPPVTYDAPNGIVNIDRLTCSGLLTISGGCLIIGDDP